MSGSNEHFRVALYARFSTDRQNPASIDDQFRNCFDWLDRQGFAYEIVGRYQDEAITGSRDDRPAYRQMLAASAKKKFDLLVVDDFSRFSRDELDARREIRNLTYRGIRVVCVSDGCDSAAKGHKVQFWVRGFINEIYLDDLRDKTHRGLVGKALKGMNTGGKVYGYTNVPIFDPLRLDETGRPAKIGAVREVAPEQAKWVVWIFEHFADGWSPGKIAAELNRKQVPSPRGGTWASSAIYGDMQHGTGILNNELYIGRALYNRSKFEKNPETKRRQRFERPAEDVKIKEIPEYRIVSNELWEQVKERQRQIRKKSVKIVEALKSDKARTGRTPKYVLSGLLKCGHCGANFVIVAPGRYGCASHKNRGPAVCKVGISVKRELVENKILQVVRERFLHQDAIRTFVEAYIRRLSNQSQETAHEADKLRDDLAKVETDIRNIMAAIKAGIITETTKAELESAEAAKKHLQRKIDSHAGGKRTKVDVQAIERRFREMLKDLTDSFAANPERARQYIASLVGQEILLYPTENGVLEAVVSGSLEALMGTNDSQVLDSHQYDISGCGGRI